MSKRITYWLYDRNNPIGAIRGPLGMSMLEVKRKACEEIDIIGSCDWRTPNEKQNQIMNCSRVYTFPNEG